MSCPETPRLTRTYFTEELSVPEREAADRHIAQCGACAAEVRALRQVQHQLEGWRDEEVPHWSRGMELFPASREKRARFDWQVWNPWQWVPTAASVAMLVVLALNTSLTMGDGGISVSFGAGTGAAAPSWEDEFEAFRQRQEAVLTAAVSRLEARQDNSDDLLMQVVANQPEQAADATAEQFLARFEQRRLQDLEEMQVNYQELADSDRQTMQTLQRLIDLVNSSGQVQ